MAWSGCSQAVSTLPRLRGSGSPAFVKAAAASNATYRDLFDFDGERDGGLPYGGLAALGGQLYGTTFTGGTKCQSVGCGTAFVINPTSGVLRTIHQFEVPHGSGPYASLVAWKGRLYGTTYSGSASAAGIVFALSPSGTFRELFTPSQDSAVFVFTAVTPWQGKLYGTTTDGGANTQGSVFAVDPVNGGGTTVYSCSRPNCAHPVSRLEPFNGHLYGTSHAGGTEDVGTIFEVNADGGVSVVHSFTRRGKPAGRTGVFPRAGLVALAGKLYGTTEEGGYRAQGNAYGTIFSFDPTSGAYAVLHSFSASDGGKPQSDLVAYRGKLYGTTTLGGGSGGVDSSGTAFEFDPATDAYRVLHRFTGGTQGWAPFAGLTVLGNVLYGTTHYGGKFGLGNVFSIVP